MATVGARITWPAIALYDTPEWFRALEGIFQDIIRILATSVRGLEDFSGSHTATDIKEIQKAENVPEDLLLEPGQNLADVTWDMLCYSIEAHSGSLKGNVSLLSDRKRDRSKEFLVFKCVELEYPIKFEDIQPDPRAIEAGVKKDLALKEAGADLVAAKQGVLIAEQGVLIAEQEGEAVQRRLFGSTAGYAKAVVEDHFGVAYDSTNIQHGVLYDRAMQRAQEMLEAEKNALRHHKVTGNAPLGQLVEAADIFGTPMGGGGGTSNDGSSGGSAGTGGAGIGTRGSSSQQGRQSATERIAKW